MSSIVRQNDDRIDELEATMIESFIRLDCPIVNRFTKGMYIREIFMPEGALITSKIHKTEHPFTISKGSAMVSVDGGEWYELKAPYTGITKPGTRRILFILEDCIWTTYHPYKSIKGTEGVLSEEKQEQIIGKIEKRIIEKHVNKILQKHKEDQLWLG